MDVELQYDADPVELCSRWFAEAKTQVEVNYNAVSLATCDAQGRPDVRVVLVKNIHAGGLEFFTNRESTKAKHLQANPYGAMVVYWAKLNKQIRVRGIISELGREQVAKYFATRSRASQLGAWSSSQSRPMAEFAVLQDAVKKYEGKFAGSEVALPDHWTGYVLEPQEMEFWIEGDARLHRRLRFTRLGSADPWQPQWLFP